MQQTIQLGQVQPSVLSKVEAIVKNLRQWWQAQSPTATLLMGEPTTHGCAVKANALLLLGFVAMMLAVAVVNQLFGMEGGAL